MEAEITLEYDDVSMAESVARAVSPDNSVTPTGLSVDTRTEKNKVITKIICSRGFKTFIATVDDLLFSIATAEKTLRETLKLQT